MDLIKAESYNIYNDENRQYKLECILKRIDEVENFKIFNDDFWDCCGNPIERERLYPQNML